MSLPEINRTEARRKAEENSRHNDMKQHADKLIQGFQKLSDNHAKRAIWELFQNAIDLSENAEIVIEHAPGALIFKHNGKPFDDNTLNCLIKQVSSKYGERNDEEIGQYGTGFISTHSFGRRILLSGSLKNENSFIPLTKFELDRTPKTSPELIKELVKQQDVVFDLIEKSEYVEQQAAYTEFAYVTESELQKSYAEEAINSMPVILPYVMILNKRLHKVTITDKVNNTTVYRKTESKPKENIIVSEIKIDGKSKTIYTIENSDPQITVILPIKENYEAFIFDNQLSKLFLYYPMIGTEKFGMNFIIHSKQFSPTEQRDGIYLKSKTEQVQENEEENRKLIQKASEMIFDFIEVNAASIQNPINLAQISFNILSDKPLLNEYFTALKKTWIEKFKTFPLVETKKGNLEPSNAVFFHNEILSSPDTFESIYTLVSRYWDNIPKKELVYEWTRIIYEWNLETITYVTIKDLVLKIQEDGRLEKFENITDLCAFYLYLIDNGHGACFNQYKLLPNIKGELRHLSALNNNISLPDILIEIADVIMPDVPKRHIHTNFKFNLELSPYNRTNYKIDINEQIVSIIKDDTVSTTVSAESLSKLIDYCKLTTAPDTSSVPSKMMKLICQYYKHDDELISIPPIKEDELDIRTPQKRLIRLFLNDISKEESVWVIERIEFLKKVIEIGAPYYEYEEMFKTLAVFPNQLNELTVQSYLQIEDNIPPEIKDLYDKVIKPNYPIRANLVHSEFTDYLKNKEKRTVRSLTEKIETAFSGDGQYSDINEHLFKNEILFIIQKITTEPKWDKYFPILNEKRANVMLDMVTDDHIKNDVFSIVSLKPDKINLLGALARNENLERIIKLGQEAFISEQQDNANFQYKYAIGTHIEKILRQSLTNLIPENIKADVKDVQDGQDIILTINDVPVYFVEVKSRWDVNSSVRMSKNQTIKAYEQRSNYALCSVDMTKYQGENKYNIENIEEIREYIRINVDIGDKVIHLIDVLSQTNEPDSIHLDGDFRTLIPQKYIEEGKSLDEFESFLIQFLKDKNGFTN